MLKNIVIVQDFATINGGNAKVALTSAIYLKKQGYRVIVFSGMAPIYKPLLEVGVEVYCLEQADILSSNKLLASIRGLWNLVAAKKMAEVLNNLNSSDTIVHLHGWNKVLSPSIWKPIRKGNFKVVVTLHDFYLFCPTLGLFDYKKKRICNKKPFSTSCYFCNCDSRNYIQKIWRNCRQVIQWVELKKYGKFDVIAIGETNKYLCIKYLKDRIRKCYKILNPIDLNNNDVVDIKSNNTYLFVGRLSTEKGIDLFCRSLTDLNLKGCVLGDGYLLEKYKKTYPNIRFLGWVDGERKDAAIKNAKVLVFPSLWYEGAPLTPIEMKSYGIPSIVPDKCAASEIIEDGVDGYVFRIGDIESLKEAILKFERTDLKEMQERLLQKFDPLTYSMDTHISELLICYNSILNQK